MAHRTKVNGTTYEIKGGRTKVSGTGYGISKGRTKVGGTGYDVSFSNLMTVTLLIPRTTDERANSQGAGTIYPMEHQTIVLQVDSSITTFAELAASSEYNTINPDSGGHKAVLTTYTNTSSVSGFPTGTYPAVRYESSLVNAKMHLVKYGIGSPDEIEIFDGVTINLSGSDGGADMAIPDFNSKWKIGGA